MFRAFVAAGAFVAARSMDYASRTMKTADDVESYLLKCGLPYEQVKPGLWIVQLEQGESMAVSIAGPVLVFRAKVMDTPATDREALFRTLLSLNTTEMVHGAYGLEGDAVVVVHALDLENLDLNELQAVFDDVSLALAKHNQTLGRWKGHGGAAAGNARIA